MNLCYFNHRQVPPSTQRELKKRKEHTLCGCVRFLVSLSQKLAVLSVEKL